MTLTTNLPNRVKNTHLPYSHGLLPLFEAVQNSIHSIEEGQPNSSSGRIDIEILRNTQANIIETGKRGPDAQPEIVGFCVTDNGLGFTSKNMKSFETLDSDLKASIGGRGVGRLLWLKAFSFAEIDSTFLGDDESVHHRHFSFTAKQGVIPGELEIVDRASPIKTSVTLSGFDEKYRNASLRTAEAISNHLFEHCLWYFVREGGAPDINIRDGESTIRLDDVYQEHMHSSAERDELILKEQLFEIVHIKLKTAHTQSHRIGWCAANRLVKEESISSKVPGLHGKLGNDDDQFVYMSYVSSTYLDERVRPERTDFNLETHSSRDLLSDQEVSLDELRDAVLIKVSEFLDPYLAETRQAGIERINDFVSNVQPRYRTIVQYIPESDRYIDPEISDKDLDIFLHKYRSSKERELISEGHHLMKPEISETIQDYEEKVKSYLQLADHIKQSDLAEYVSHRKVILDILSLAISKKEDGSYAKEELIHELIMPMRQTSNSVEFERNNLWLIDERLAFHDFLASDKTLNSMPVTGSSENKEPDIFTLNIFDQPVLVSQSQNLPLASIVVVEIKRPMRNDARSGETHDPIEQSLSYLNRIRNGGVNTSNGRPIPESEDIPGYCYVVCDLTPSVIERCKMIGLTVTSDHMGYFGFNPNYKAYIEVISFDQLLNAAKERNRAFFEKLGLPNN